MNQFSGNLPGLIQASLDHLDGGLAIFDRDLRLVHWNKAFAERFDYPHRLMKAGRSAREFIAINAERGLYGAGDAKVIAEARFQQFSRRVQDSSVRTFPDGRIIELKWFPLPDGEMLVVCKDITGQRRTEEVLRRQAEIIQGLHEAVCVSDVSGMITGWNRAAERLWGYSPDEVLGQHRSFLVAPGQRHTPEPEIHKEIKAEGEYRREIRCARKGGAEFTACITISLLEEEHNGPSRLVSFVRDITALKRAEAEALQTQQRFEAFMANSPVIAFIKDSQGRLIFANRVYEETLGPKRRHWMGKRVSDLWDEETAGQLREADMKVRATGMPIVAEESIDTGNGVRIFLVSRFPIDSDTGEKMLGGLALDLTGTRKTEQALRESETRLRGVHENAADGIFTIDEKGVIETTNRAAEEMFGYAPGELLGKQVAMLMAGDHKLRHQGYIEKYIKTGRGQILGVGPRELTGIRKDGSALAIDLAVNVMELDDRRIFVGVVRDITDRKETRKQLLQAQKMEAVGQLTGGIAHDFNNMLAVVLGNLELAVEHFAEGRDISKLLELALEGATRGSDLTKRLLAFSRQQFLEPRVVDINQTIGEMTDILERTIGEGVVIDMNTGSGLWRTRIDPVQLQSAVLNLAINGRDAVPEGGRLRITTANIQISEGAEATALGLAPGDYVVVTVADNGTGISAENMEHIFEPFFTTKEVGKGSGLGLSMVHGFAAQSGGMVIAKSKLGQGTEILIYLPRSDKWEEARPAVPESTNKAGAGALRALLVEDDREVRALVAGYLRAMGFQVTEVENGLKIDEILQDNPRLDLLLTDMALPGGVGGVEISRRVRKKFPEAKVLYMSGYAAHSMLHGETIEESARLIQKPFRRRELHNAISEFLHL